MATHITEGMTLVSPGHAIDFTQVKENLTRVNPQYVSASLYGRGFKPKAGIVKDLTFYTNLPGTRQILVPRNCPASWFTAPLPASECKGRKMTGKFTGTLRGYQVDFFTDNPVNETNDKIVVAPCGHGKTVMAVYHACVKRRATLVLVPTITLAEQWLNRIKSSTTCTAGIWYSNKKRKDFNVDFLIMTFDLFVSRKPDATWCAQWGHVIFDEAHRVGAPTYGPVAEVLPAMYRTALTATFRRSDKMEEILAYHFGPAFILESQFPPAKVYEFKTGRRVYDSVAVAKIKRFEEVVECFAAYGLRPIYNGANVAFINAVHETSGKLIRQTMAKAGVHKKWAGLMKANRALPGKIKGGATFYDTWVTQDPTRVKQMRTLIKRLLAAGRTVLFLSKRTRNLQIYYRLFKDVVPTCLVVGGMEKMTAEQDAFMQKEARLILGIAQLAKEGLDVERLDTLVCEQPFSDVEQAIGRIVRYMPGKKQALAIFPQDTSGYYAGILRKGRRTFPTDTELTGTFSLLELPKVLSKTR